MDVVPEGSSLIFAALTKKWDEEWAKIMEIFLTKDLENVDETARPDLKKRNDALRLNIARFSPRFGAEENGFYTVNREILGTIDPVILGIKQDMGATDLVAKIHELSELLSRLWLEHAYSVMKKSYPLPLSFEYLKPESQYDGDTGYSVEGLGYHVVIPYLLKTIENLRAKANQEAVEGTGNITHSLGGALQAASSTDDVSRQDS